jgi:hypothetical protein
MDALGSAGVASFVIGGIAAAGTAGYLLWPGSRNEELAKTSFTVIPGINAGWFSISTLF